MTSQPAVSVATHPDPGLELELALMPLPLPDPPEGYMAEQMPHISLSLITLIDYFAGQTVLVMSNGYVCRDTRKRDGWLVPDLLVALDTDPVRATQHNGYVIDLWGKPPEFVLEVGSKYTGKEDYNRKRFGYADYGVSEYWRFDSTGGEYHDAPLAGDLLVDGEYQPIPLTTEPDGTIRGYSAVLGLTLCWDQGELRFYDPQTQQYLLWPQEMRAEMAETNAQLEAERAALTGANAQLEAERAALTGANAQLEAERAARQAAEAQLAALREELGLSREESGPEESE